MHARKSGQPGWLGCLVLVLLALAGSKSFGLADEPRPGASATTSFVAPITTIPTPPWLKEADVRQESKPDDRGMLTALALSPPARLDVQTPTAVQLIAQNPRGVASTRSRFRQIKPVE